MPLWEVDMIRTITEEQRLDVLQGYGLLDTPEEPQFDAIVRAAAAGLRAPIALISLVDSGRQWFKARIGLDLRQTCRSVSFCARAIEEDGVLEVDDTTVDARFADNPLVTGEPHIRFYAGMPIQTERGARLGTICVLDTKPRNALTIDEKESLRAFARRAMEAIELRRAVRDLQL
jgi:putative two-component system response regulator